MGQMDEVNQFLGKKNLNAVISVIWYSDWAYSSVLVLAPLVLDRSKTSLVILALFFHTLVIYLCIFKSNVILDQ